MTSANMAMSGHLMRPFIVLLCVVFVGCSDTCPGECSCSGIFECELLSYWPAIPAIGEPTRVTQLRLQCVDSGSLGSLSGIERFTSLTIITIHHCRNLSDIPEGILAHAPKLTSIDLSDNAIRDVHARSFVGLGMLETLTLDANGIEDLPPSTFHGLQRLKHLKLSNNKIASVATGLFTNNNALEEIDMSMNALTKIGADHFGHLTQLQSLILTSNVIRTLAPGCFSTTSLREIYLSSNAIDYIDESMFHSNLQKLFASSNRITGLPEALLLKLKALSEFHLGQNPFHCNCEILALVRFIKENNAVAMVDVDDVYKCATPFVANLIDVNEANVTCVAPKAQRIKWDDVGNSAICRGTGDPAPMITWTLSNSKTELVRVLPSHNKAVLHTEATLPRSAWRDGGAHVCRVWTALGQQYETFFLRVDIEVRNRSVTVPVPSPSTPTPDSNPNLVVVIGAVVVTFLVTLLVTAVATVIIMKRRNIQTSPPPPRNSLNVSVSPQATNDNSSSPGVVKRQDSASRSHEYRHSKLEIAPQSPRNTYTNQHRNSEATPSLPPRNSMSNDNSSRQDGATRRRENHRNTLEGVPRSPGNDTSGVASLSDNIYEGLEETTRELDVDPVYTDLPDGHYEQSTITFSEG